ncbi:MAG: hypothetical protein WKF96_05555 [Solirubrobacteraceae bacterium]
MDGRVTRPRLYINHPGHLDWLIALEFGRVDDGQPLDCWERVSEHFVWLHDGPDGPIVGFKVMGFSTFDANDDEHAAIWTGPRFYAPLVGLTDASAGEITIAAATLLDGHDTTTAGGSTPPSRTATPPTRPLSNGSCVCRPETPWPISALVARFTNLAGTTTPTAIFATTPR